MFLKILPHNIFNCKFPASILHILSIILLVMFMFSTNKIIGNNGEKIAVNYLIKNNFEILEKNFRYKTGEIDVICKDKDTIVFTEVKTRFSLKYGFPSEAVTLSKQKKIIRTAQYYIMKKKFRNYNFRFDVIEIFIDNFTMDYKINLIKNAFGI